ncbi:MAG: serine hydrolase domain-containing protein, partial [Myxococcota bacterium]
MQWLGIVWLVACSDAPFETGAALPRPDGPVPVDHAPGSDEAVQAEVERLMTAFVQNDGPPGIGIALVRDGAVLYSGGYGWADFAAERSLEADTPVLLSSVSKTFVGVAAM